MLQFFLLALAALLSLPSAALAQAEDRDDAQEFPGPVVPFPAEAPEEAPSKLVLESMRLEVSGLLYAYWAYSMKAANPDVSTNGANRFDVSRAFINVESQITPSITARVTPDVVRVRDENGNLDGSLALRLFFAYVRFADVAPGVAVVGGLQANPLNAFDDSVWQYRVLGTSIFNVMTGAPTTDLGVGVTGKHLGGLLEYHLLLSNGEGGFQTEPNKYKTGTARFTLAPFSGTWSKGLRLSVLGNFGIQDRLTLASGEERHLQKALVEGLLSFEHERGTLAVGVGPTWDSGATGGERTQHGLLFTTFGFLNLPLDLRLLGRFDFFDPDLDHEAKTSGQNPTTGERTRVIGGVAYRFNQQVQLIANYQRFGYEVPDRTKASDPGETLNLHMEARF